MDPSSERAALYQETLETALAEAGELDTRIQHLRALLDKLEKHNLAVESICHAVGKWIEVADEVVPGPPNSLALPLDFPNGSIGLSEEEVSLLTLPTGFSGKA